MLYHIKNAMNRRITNLTTYSNAIISGVLIEFPSAVVNVYADFFEILNVPSASYTSLRAMGKAIAANSPYLNSLKKTYGNSNQLFVSF